MPVIIQQSKSTLSPLKSISNNHPECIKPRVQPSIPSHQFPPPYQNTDVMLVSHLRLFATLAVAAAIGVSAQVEDLCMASCTVNSESPDTCPNSANTRCVCTNAAYQAAVTACLKSQCTEADLQSAQQLQQQLCSSLSGSTSNSTSSTTSATSPGSSTTAPSSSTSSSPKKNGAVHDQLPFLNRAITFATIALGGALIL